LNSTTSSMFAATITPSPSRPPSPGSSAKESVPGQPPSDWETVRKELYAAHAQSIAGTVPRSTRPGVDLRSCSPGACSCLFTPVACAGTSDPASTNQTTHSALPFQRNRRPRASTNTASGLGALDRSANVQPRRPRSVLTALLLSRPLAHSAMRTFKMHEQHLQSQKEGEPR
jgi:hypothetical protein